MFLGWISSLENAVRVCPCALLLLVLVPVVVTSLPPSSRLFLRR